MHKPIIASFAWNHEGLGHVSRLVAIHTALHVQGIVESLFFDEHHQQLIDDYGYPQIILPTYAGSLIGDEWWGADVLESEVSQSLPTIARSIIHSALHEMQGIIVHDVVIHGALYEWGVQNNWLQALIFRERKDHKHPGSWVQSIAPAINMLFWVGHQDYRDKYHNIQVIGTANIIRQLQGEQSIWRKEQQQNLRVLITAGGGGHSDAEEFLNLAVDAICQFASTSTKPVSLFILTGPYYRGQIHIKNGCIAEIVVRAYLSPQWSAYRDTSLVLCQGGYNTINELLKAGIPAVLMPATRRLDNQEQRVVQAAKNQQTVYYTQDKSIAGIVKGITTVLSITCSRSSNKTIPENGAEQIASHLLELL